MRCKISIVGLILALAILPSTVLSNDDILIVPQDTSGFQILDQILLANDVSDSRIVSYTTTSRGTLSYDSSGFIYVPNPEFQAAGMDSFRYEQESGNRALVFLVANTYGDPRVNVDLELEIGSSPGTVVAQSGSLGKDSFAWEAKDSEARLITDDTEGSGYLRLRMDPALARRGPSDSGGTLGTDIDPSGLTMPAGTEIEIATILVNDEPDLDLILSYDGSSHLLSSRVWRDATPIEVSSISLDEGSQSATIRWWSSSNRESQSSKDGGLSVEIGNKVMASMSSLDRRDHHHPTSVEIRFGAMNAGHSSGTLRLANSRYWQLAGTFPALTPIFADGAESGDTSAWTATVGTVDVTTAAAIRGGSGISIPATFAAYLIDDSPTRERHFRARFNVDVDPLTLAGGSQLTLLTGTDGVTNPFSVDLRGQGLTGREICGTAQSASGPIETQCFAINAEHSVEVNWWAAAESQGTGGLILRLKGTSLADHGVTTVAFQLENHGQTIDEIQFGVIDPGAGNTGSLHLDDFESWR